MRPSPAASSRTFIPELHDVSPNIGDRLERMMELLPESARSAACLLVVPNWSGTWPLDRHPDFVDRVQALGNDRVLHGYTHSLGPDRWNRLVWGTDNHAEFGRASAADAGKLLALGQRMFEQIFGGRARWFCAPRWQQSAAASIALATEGLHGHMMTDGFGYSAGSRDHVPAVWFDDGRTPWRAKAGALLRQRRLARILRHGQTFRLALHPADLDDAAVVAELRVLTRWLLDDGWTATSLPRRPSVLQ